MSPEIVALLLRWFGIVSALAALLATPYLTPRRLLFGVLVPAEFRGTDVGRAALRGYRWRILLAASPGVASAAFLPKSPGAMAGSLLLLGAAGVGAFLDLNRRVRPYGVEPAQTRVVAIGPPEAPPRFLWLGLLPVALLAAAALYVSAHWDAIPLRFPVHFDINGAANRWATRTVRGVFGPLLVGAVWSLLTLGLACAGWYGSRTSDRMRRPTTFVMLSVEALLACVFSVIPLNTALGLKLPIPLMIFGPLLLVVPAMIYAVRKSNEPGDPDPTPNECWRGGMIYSNPDDAALFVQRRDGMGFTVNFGHPWSWPLYGAIVAAVIATAVVLRP